MKRLLIILYTLNVGGVERSCVNFLRTLPQNRYEVDLFLLNYRGPLKKQIPSWIHAMEIPYPYNCLCHNPKEWRFYIRHNPLIWVKKVIRAFRGKLQSELHFHQSVYRQWEADLPMLGKEYDVAISFVEGISNYLVLDKVRTKRKIVWIHSCYDKLGYNPAFDNGYFTKADVIVTVSPTARQILQENFPNLADRVWCIENISNAETLRTMAGLPVNNEVWKEFDGLKIVSCGRLEPVKSYETAVMAAAIIKKEGIPFRWVLVGDGSEKHRLKRLIRDMDLAGEFYMLGMFPNPYPVIKQADMMVVTSLYEGCSMAIDEAKILGCPVITTNYPTAADAVEHGESGLICDMTPEAVADTVIRLYRDKQLCGHIRKNLIEGKWDNTAKLSKYIKAIEGGRIK